MRNRIAPFVAVLVVLALLANTALPALADDSVQYTYDANGNLISDGEQCYSYNDANQLAAVRTCANNQLIVEYLYDHAGRRIIEKHYQNGQLAETVYTIGQHTETAVPAGGARTDTTYIRVNNELVARNNPDASTTYYHPDHLGSTSLLTDASGAVVEETRYYPFGVVREGGALSRFLYTGQEADAETGLYYYGARFYDPALARFVQPDSLLPDAYDPQQLNRYSYVVNNPLKYVDPTGNWPSLQDVGSALKSTAETAKSYVKLFCGSCGEYTASDSARVNPAMEKAWYGAWSGVADFGDAHAETISFFADLVDSMPVGSQHADNIRYFFGQISTEEFRASSIANSITMPLDALTAGLHHNELEAFSDVAATHILLNTGHVDGYEALQRDLADSQDYLVSAAFGHIAGKSLNTKFARTKPFSSKWFLGPAELNRRGAWVIENVVGGSFANYYENQIRSLYGE